MAQNRDSYRTPGELITQPHMPARNRILGSRNRFQVKENPNLPPKQLKKDRNSFVVLHPFEEPQAVSKCPFDETNFLTGGKGRSCRKGNQAMLVFA
jgi:hypothetical protein